MKPTIQSWVNGDCFRTVKIQGHCSGVRLTLETRNGEVSFSTAPSVQQAFDEAVSYATEGEKRIRRQRMSVLELMVCEESRQLKSKKDELKKLKTEFHDTRKKGKK